MTAEHFAEICALFYELLSLDPQFARYLKERRERERRRLGLAPREEE